MRTEPLFVADSFGKSFRGREVLKAATAWATRGTVTVLFGRNGSGKSTLTRDILYHSLAEEGGGATVPGAHDTIEGRDRVGAAVLIDQSPIGRTPRSNPGTYVGAMAPIRQAFAATREARLREPER